MTNRQILLLIVLCGVLVYGVLSWQRGATEYAVTMESESVLLLDGEDMSRAAIVSRIRDEVAEGRVVSVRIEADEDLPAGSVIDLKRELESAGARDVVLAATVAP